MLFEFIQHTITVKIHQYLIVCNICDIFFQQALSIIELDGLELCDHFKFENGTSGKENW